jgi:methylmalonyl-CoA mutase
MSDVLFGEFPPVSKQDWMSAIEKDLKGADFEKKLVWSV